MKNEEKEEFELGSLPLADLESNNSNFRTLKERAEEIQSDELETQKQENPELFLEPVFCYYNVILRVDRIQNHVIPGSDTLLNEIGFAENKGRSIDPLSEAFFYKESYFSPSQPYVELMIKVNLRELKNSKKVVTPANKNSIIPDNEELLEWLKKTYKDSLSKNPNIEGLGIDLRRTKFEEMLSFSSVTDIQKLGKSWWEVNKSLLKGRLFMT